MEAKFKWSETIGEGRISPADRKRLLELDWLEAADFLKDVIYDAQQLYNEVLEKKNVL